MQHDPKEPRRELKPYLNFPMGLLTGAAVSSLVPWNMLSDITPGLRLASVAVLGACFVVFRLLTRNRVMRKTLAVGGVILGGFAMAIGPWLSALGLHLPTIMIGACLFLFGITLLMRERRVSPELREETIERLVEKDEAVQSLGVDTAERRGFPKGVGEKPLAADFPDTPDSEEPKDPAVFALARAVDVNRGSSLLPEYATPVRSPLQGTELDRRLQSSRG